MTWIRFYQAFIFAATFLVGALIPLFPLIKADGKRTLKLVLFSLLTFAQIFLVEFLNLGLLTLWLDYASFAYLRYLLEFMLEILIFPLLCRLSFISSLFVVNIAYCFQHVCQYLYQIVLLPTGLEMLSWQGILIRVVFTIVYSLVFFALSKKRFANIEPAKIHESLTLVVSSMLVIFATIVLNSMVWIKTDSDQSLFQLYILFSSLIVGILIIALNINILDKDILYDELSVTKKLFHAQSAHYRNERQVIDALNIKTHDLKHQLLAIRPKLATSDYEELTQLVDTYESIFKTGNKTIDLVLTEKEILCRNKSIRFTSLLDGKRFSFMHESDLYSLLGNLLDNAIEACEKLQDPEKRVIALTSETSKGFLCLHEENYFEGPLQFENGLPQTTKKDRFFHGIGTKSLALIAQKYGGSMSMQTKGDIFVVDMLFPLAEEGEEGSAIPDDLG